MKKKYETLRLILGDQLNENHTFFSQNDNSVLYLMAETLSEQQYVTHHIQKIKLFFKSMRLFAEKMREKGHHFLYFQLNDPENEPSLPELIKKTIHQYNIKYFEYLEPDEYRLEITFQKLCEELKENNIISKKYASKHFLLSREEAVTYFLQRKGKHRLMEHFYQMMRKKLNILIDNEGKPVGGKWNYDAENRKMPHKGTVFSPLPTFGNDFSDVTETILQSEILHFGQSEGRLSASFPVNREQALILLDHFIEYALPGFGDFQDAMLKESLTLNHSLLSFAMNIKLINPEEVVKKVLENPEKVGLASMEGFIRQIIGWREYVRGLYWAEMPAYADLNFFRAERKLPDYFWTGETNMNCIRHAVGNSLENAYAHHIQRLMITGNFATLTGIRPDEINAWYLGIYADAIEWVQLPNTHGMSQFADGGMMASKPYVSSGNYIRKMSNYCDGCKYNVKERTGAGACPFNAWYWDFLERNREVLQKNGRMGQMYALWDKFDSEEKKNIRESAQKNFERIEKL